MSHTDESKTRVYEGWIAEHASGEAEDVLYLSLVKEPLAEAVSQEMWDGYTFLSVRYFTSDKQASISELEEAEIHKIVGGGNKVKFQHRYSEITGYLWTDEYLVVGGHDLLAELRTHLGDWCHLAITFNKQDA